MRVKERQKIRVIYCMGSGRSGSTLFGIILGNHPHILGPGELNEICRLGEENFNCSCGRKVDECKFWSAVIKDWRSCCGDSLVKETLSKIGRFENFKSPIAWLKAILNYPGERKKFRDYQYCLYEFYRIISQKSNKSIITDISKNPLRAFILNKNPNLDLSLIHLVRDGRGVAWSLKKGDSNQQDKRPIWRSAIFWLIVNWQSNYVRKRTKKNILIRYEDLINSPELTLTKLGELVDFSPKPILKNINSDIALEEPHIMAGNQLRRQKKIILKLNTEWEKLMPIKKNQIFKKIAGKTLKSYGY